jgi:diketogulonate reductase-like aldo/keto reductase
MPYDPSAPLEEQITQSVTSSLKNLETPDSEPYIDCLVLHSPLNTFENTVQAFKILKEKYVPRQIRHLGISNVPSEYVRRLGPEVLSVVQNRFTTVTHYEREMRYYCRANGIVFQSFWTLTGNPLKVQTKFVSFLADQVGVSNEVAFYALVLGLQGITILDGTTNEQRMKDDLDGIVTIGRWAEGPGQEVWQRTLEMFKKAIGEVE